jgi:hypothetical protein
VDKGRELEMAKTAASVDQQEIAPNTAPQIAHTFLLIGLASFSLAALGEARLWGYPTKESDLPRMSI